MNSHFAATLISYFKRIKLVGVALALVFLANLSLAQFAAPESAKTHCTMQAQSVQAQSMQLKSAQHQDANNAHDCCPKRGKVPNRPDCCKYPCYTQVVTQIPILLGAADIAVAIFPVELPHRRYRDRLLVAFSPPELRPPII